MRYLLTKKLTHGRVWWGNYLWKQYQRLEYDWMTPLSTRKLAGSDLDYAGNASEVRKEGSLPTRGYQVSRPG